MLKIKLRRKGKKHEPHFRLVVMEKRSKLQGRFVDDLGWINPHEKKIHIEKEKTKEWIQKGAQPTDTVHNLLIKIGVMQGKKRPVHGAKKKTSDSSQESDKGEGAKTNESAKADVQKEEIESGEPKVNEAEEAEEEKKEG